MLLLMENGIGKSAELFREIMREGFDSVAYRENSTCFRMRRDSCQEEEAPGFAPPFGSFTDGVSLRQTESGG
jgi:hypothetical protein